MREVREQTKYGTDFKRWAQSLALSHYASIRRPTQLGIGGNEGKVLTELKTLNNFTFDASSGFIGGSGFSYASNLAAYSILHM